MAQRGVVTLRERSEPSVRDDDQALHSRGVADPTEGDGRAHPNVERRPVASREDQQRGPRGEEATLTHGVDEPGLGGGHPLLAQRRDEGSVHGGIGRHAGQRFERRAPHERPLVGEQ